MIIGLLHPGRMGAAVGRELTAQGKRVLWCPDGRSAATAERAAASALEPVGDLAALIGRADVIISLCPPEAAEEVATSVSGFTGLFVEANAISPEHVRRVTGPFENAVDGCVIGPPPPSRGGTRLYLSGPPDGVAAIARLFAGTAVEAIAVDGDIGQASALKMAFGAFNKASGALAAVSHALADAYGVGDRLLDEARRLGGGHLAELDVLPSVAARAWRWAPEMREVAATLADAGLPDDLALAAAAVFERWTDDRDDFDMSVPDVLAHLRRPPR